MGRSVLATQHLVSRPRDFEDLGHLKLKESRVMNLVTEHNLYLLAYYKCSVLAMYLLMASFGYRLTISADLSCQYEELFTFPD